MQPSPPARPPAATSASRPSPAPSGSRCSRRRTPAAWASPHSSRSGTRRTCPRTTCSSGGRRTKPPSSCSSTSSRSGTRAASASGQRAASSHTAALAGSEAGVDALFRQAGVIRAASLEELIDVATLLSTQPEVRGRRVAVLTNAGGLGILAADACDAARLELPALSDETTARLRELLPAEASVANPVDMLGSATAESYAAALPVVLADPNVDALLVLFVPAVSATAVEVADAVDTTARAAEQDKPVLAVVMSSEGVPPSLRAGSAVAAFAYPESAARALGRAP